MTASGNAAFDFSQCPSPYLVWAAFRDGNGPWTRVTPTAKVFRFTINSPLAAFAYVVQQNSPSTTYVEYLTRAEISAAPFVQAGALFPTFNLVGVPNGDRDLVAYRFVGAPAVTDRVIIRRDQNLPTGGARRRSVDPGDLLPDPVELRPSDDLWDQRRRLNADVRGGGGPTTAR